MGVHFLGVVAGEILQQRGGSDCLKNGRIEKRLGQFQRVIDRIRVVVKKLDIVIDERVTNPVGSRREFGGDARIYVGIIPAIRTERIGAQQRREKFAISDHLNLTDHDAAGGLEDLLVVK